MRRIARYAFVLVVLLALRVDAQETIAVSPDLTLSVGSGGTLVADEDAVSDDSLGGVTLEDLGSLPDETEVVAFGRTKSGDRLFVLDTTTELPGAVVARPRDVIRYDGSVYSIEFDAVLAELPTGVAIDAVSASPEGLLLSFDTSAAFPGGLVVADEDLVYWTGSTFVLALDGSAAGLGDALDIDGAQERGPGSFALSFDSSGAVGGVYFDDEDVVAYDGATWTLLLDSSTLDASWEAADADAITVPEPGTSLSLLAGTFLLALAHSQRRRRNC